ncbi:hypothetical protein [Tahibacter aquaticus]|nr:hypothetical protein [Tahibacter aquaticus]
MIHALLQTYLSSNNAEDDHLLLLFMSLTRKRTGEPGASVS